MNEVAWGRVAGRNYSKLLPECKQKSEKNVALAPGFPVFPSGWLPVPSGGPLFDTTGQIVGVVTGKLDNLRIAVATGNIPENINFAIKTGALRDFLDNSVVPYQTAEPKGELKTTDIAANARAYTMLISCTGTEQANAKR